MSDLQSPHKYYNTYGGGYISRFLERNPEFDTPEFHNFVSSNNRGDRDMGELQDVAKFEVLRLASEFEERMRRFPNVYGDPKDRIPPNPSPCKHLETVRVPEKDLPEHEGGQASRCLQCGKIVR